MKPLTPRARVLLLLLAVALSLPVWGQDNGVAAPPSVPAIDEPAAPSTDDAPADDAPAADAPAADPTPTAAERHVAVIPVEDLIYEFTFDSLKRRVDRARTAGANLIVLELNTYGGTATAALDISRYLKALDIPTVTWVNDKAISAGIVIGASTDELIAAPMAVVGDTAPIIPGIELAPTERAKALTPLLQSLRDSADRNGYDFAILHAMAEYGVVVYEIEHKQTGERAFVNQLDYQIMVEGVAPEDAGKPSFFQRILPGGNEHVIDLNIERATEADRGQWKMVRKVHAGNSLLTVNAERAAELGLAKAIDIRNLDDLKAYLKADSIKVVSQTWSENLANFMTSPGVRAALIFALLLGAYAEMQTPGVGFAGGLALVALILLLAPPMIVGLAEVWHIVVIVLGVVLLAVEVFVLPGFGIAGISGLILIVAGLVFMVVPAEGEGPIPLPDPAMWGMVGKSFISVAVGLILSFVGFVILQRYIGYMPLANRLVLQSVPSPQLAGDATGEAAAVGVLHTGDGRTFRVGDAGRAITDLRPAGRAEFDGHILDVVSLGTWIRMGQDVRIIEIEGNRVVVDARES